MPSISDRAVAAVRPPDRPAGTRRRLHAPQHDAIARRRGVSDADKIARFQLRDMKALIKGRYGETIPDLSSAPCTYR
jgi:hypothetical protein